jgi:DNA-binding LacI/PurR family transcriptional regulator
MARDALTRRTGGSVAGAPGDGTVPPKRRATSIDVAAVAGVSQPTVSRALRGHPSVNAETRERVLEIARDLNYAVDRRGVRLRSGSTGNIAVIMLSPPGRDRSALNPFYYSLLGAVGVAASRHGYNLLVSFQSGPDDFRADFARTREADGTIAIGSGGFKRGWRHLRDAAAAGEKIVCWGAPDDALPTVRCDNRAAAAAATAHLIGRGRRRIAFLGPGWRTRKAFRDRRRGYLDAVEAGGGQAIEPPPVRAAASADDGYAVAVALLRAFPDCDGIVAASDGLALSAARAIRALGRSLPDDVALVGFDGVDAAAHTTPSLTTVEQDSRVAGSLLVVTLLDLLTDRPRSQAVVPTLVTVRESCGRDP